MSNNEARTTRPEAVAMLMNLMRRPDLTMAEIEACNMGVHLICNRHVQQQRRKLRRRETAAALDSPAA